MTTTRSTARGGSATTTVGGGGAATTGARCRFSTTTQPASPADSNAIPPNRTALRTGDVQPGGRAAAQYTLGQSGFFTGVLVRQNGNRVNPTVRPAPPAPPSRPVPLGRDASRQSPSAPKRLESPPMVSVSSRVVLDVAAVSKCYGARRVLDNVSFRVSTGQRVALTGPSGSGKTTLLNCLGGIDRPDAGSLTLNGHRIDQLDSDALARLRREQIGTVFQFFHLLPTLTAGENIELPLQLLGVPAAERLVRVTALLERVGLAARATAFPGQLSGGEQQRIAIARALVHRPALILADEPTGNLDSASGENILRLLRELTDETHTALVLVTHSEEAAAICHERVHLRDGRITP